MYKYLKFRVAISGIIILLSGCVSGVNFHNSNKYPTGTPTDTISSEVNSQETKEGVIVSLTSTRETTSTATVTTMAFRRQKYEFLINLDYHLQKLQVQQRITYQNSTGKPLTEIPLVIPPNYYENVFTLIDFSSDPNAFLYFSETNRQIGFLVLDETLKPGATINLSIEFQLNLPVMEGAFGYTSRQMNLVNWYPFIPPYTANQEWIINEYSPIGEYIVYDKSDFFASIQLDDPEIVVVSSAGEGMPEGEQINFTHINSRDISFSVSPFYRKISQSPGNVTINAYVFDEHVESGNELLRNTAAALIYYESLFDFRYPRSTLSIVEADFPDGMESDGMYFLSKDYIGAYDGTHRNYLTILSAHETAHQWFYGIVGNDPAKEPWLDEALCTFGELMYFEEFYPADVEWWWEYRVYGYAPQGKVDTTIYDNDTWRVYINAVYLQGSQFINALRETTGREYFIEAMRHYIQKNQDKIATADDFFVEFIPYDLTEIKEKYFSK